MKNIVPIKNPTKTLGTQRSTIKTFVNFETLWDKKFKKEDHQPVLMYVPVQFLQPAQYPCQHW